LGGRNSILSLELVDTIRQVGAVNPIVGQLADLGTQAVVSILIVSLFRVVVPTVVGVAVFPSLGTIGVRDQRGGGTVACAVA